MTTLVIQHQPEQNRFACDLGTELAVVTYRVHGNTIDFDHTYVPPAGRGTGIAARLVDAAAAWAREQGYTLTASCTYAHKYLRLSR